MSKTEIFLSRAKATHGDRYDYSKSICARLTDKITIGCKDHGFFEQSAKAHLRGNGCRKCGQILSNNAKRLDNNSFISRSRVIHGDLYSYDNCEYKGRKLRLTVTCHKHGDFAQRACDHLSGKGCPSCANEKRNDGSKHNTDTFIAMAKAVHADAYGYGMVDYKSYHEKVSIKCAIHGYYDQTPAIHLAGGGCRQCGYERSSAKCRSNVEAFIESARETHGGIYDYTNVEYVNARTKVSITCAKHGDFEQEPQSHLAGRGCPLCLWSRDRETYVYIMEMCGLHKIGVSVNPIVRLDQLNKNNPSEATLIAKFLLDDFTTALQAEKMAHSMLSANRAGLSGFDGSSEWFDVSLDSALNAVERSVKEIKIGQ